MMVTVKLDSRIAQEMLKTRLEGMASYMIETCEMTEEIYTDLFSIILALREMHRRDEQA